MIRKLLCAILSVTMLICILSLNVTAQGDTGKFTGEPPKVESYRTEEMLPGMALWSARSIADSFPNNPPEDVDTVSEKVDWIAQKCREAGMTDTWEIALWLHDWLIYNANYDYTYTIYTPDGVLLKGTGVCQSYAEAYELLLNKFSIENIFVGSYAMNHAWNLVKIDGEWCHIDCTWDDPGEGGYECHTYFGASDKIIGADHIWPADTFPPCTSKINYYPVRMGYDVFETKAEMMEILCKRAAAKTEALNLYYIGGDPTFDILGTFKEWYQTYGWDYNVSGYGGSYTQLYLEFKVTYWNGPNTHTHRYQEEVVSPTCTEEGYTLHYCGCGDSYTDNRKDSLGHTGGTATCTAAAVCTRCETAYGQPDGTNHVGDTVLLNQDPGSCTAEGYTGDTCCLSCRLIIAHGTPIPAPGHQYTSVITPPTETEQGYTTHTCSVCGDSYIDSYVDPIPAPPDVELPAANVQLARMILGNELAMQFAFKAAPIVDGVDYVVSITKTYADGRPDVNVKVPQSQWVSTTSGGQPYFYVSFNGIAAKEMGDEIRVQIMTADGTPVGDVYTSSVMNYAVTQLRKTSVAVTRTLYVDLLNYGAAAQTYFKYDDQNLVNAGLTETEKGYATKTIELENNLIKGTGYSASQLDLGSSILLRVRFNGIDSSMHAVVSFTNHTGRKIESRIEGDQFLYSGTVVVIDDVVAADYAQDVTVKVYDANGNEVANAVESVASYLARQLDKPGALAIYDAVAKYCASAYAYLHR